MRGKDEDKEEEKEIQRLRQEKEGQDAHPLDKI